VSQTAVLITLDPNDKDAAYFREAVAQSSFLQERVELRFATGEAIGSVLERVEVVCCGNLAPHYVEQAKNLKWISFWSAGMDGKATPQLLERKLTLTNASGVHGNNIAEHVMAWMLMFTRNMHYHLRAQIEGVWRRDKMSAGAGELAGQTLGIVGLGRIGEGLAVRAQAFGMRVIATKRNPSSRYDSGVVLDAVYGAEELPLLLSESDHVCVSVPYTNETHHLLNAAMLSHLKPTAYIYNIARGKVIEESALIEALAQGRIAGAGLDVFEQEPLPAESPLWKMENVLISPHTAGVTPHYFARTADLFTANLVRYLQDTPLENRFDSTRGY
jgi:phosphoglycerate dehydrogenase-like enzyme